MTLFQISSETLIPYPHSPRNVGGKPPFAPFHVRFFGFNSCDFGWEIDPRSVYVIDLRWQTHAGEQVLLEHVGRSCQRVSEGCGEGKEGEPCLARS
jgi:hypothetical protein